MKKHRLPIVLAAALISVTATAFPAATETQLSIVAEAANGDIFNYGDYKCSHGPNSGEATIEEYTGSSPNANIPDYVYDWNGKKLKVKKVADYAFVTVVPASRPGSSVGFIPKNITSLTVPSTVTYIGDCAFYQCSTLQTVNLSSNLTYLGSDAFSQCTSLSSIALPSSLTEIQSGTFEGCTKLTSITIPATVTQIGYNAFSNCTKLKTLDIKGAAHIEQSSFQGCTSLTNAKLNANCTAEQNAFTDCSSLTQINSTSPWNSTRVGKPVFTNSTIKKLIRNVFKHSVRIKFVDEYCTALCNYVVRTETADWMSDAVKARQLHDWFAYHYEYEDFDEVGYVYNNGVVGKIENQDYASFFLSYGIDERGTEIGETVCAGSAKAFTMLLKAAGIESYVVHGKVGTTGWHAWNIIRIKEGDVYKYYQSDVGAGDQNYNTQMIQYGINHYGCYTNYEHFLISAAQMYSLQGNQTTSQSIEESSNHPYFHYNLAEARAAMNQCNYNYNCNLLEGLLTGDWDFNGTVDYSDTLLSMYINYYYTNNYPGVSFMNAWFTDTVRSGMEPWDYIRYIIAN